MSVLLGSEPFPASLKSLCDRAWVVGALGLVLCLALLFVDRTRSLMLPAYLIGFVFWFGIAMGGTSLTMLHHLTGGSWGLLARRPLEAASMVILPLAILFLPIALGIRQLYPWMNPNDPFEHEIQKKVLYLNAVGFWARSAGFFLIWGVIAVVLNRLSRAQDTSPTREPTRWLQALSAPGLGLVFLTGSFASIDWLMSLEPEWSSSIYPAMLITGWGLATWSCVILVVGALRRTQPMEKVATPSRFQDIASLTLAFVMLWAYTSFMQYLIIWSGNLTEEIPWYLRRVRGGWQYFAFALILFHFFTPFFLLLSRVVKRRAPKLMTLALFILLMHLIDGMWLVLPAQMREPLATPSIPWIQVALSLLATGSIGGICIGFYLTFLQQSSLVPVNDPAADVLEQADDDHDEDDEIVVHGAPHRRGAQV
jgi:hypothetical protein